MFNLVDFCVDEEIRRRAEIVLDLLCSILARYSVNGNFGSFVGTCYADKKMCGYEPGVGDLIEVLFGTRGGVIVWLRRDTRPAASPRVDVTSSPTCW